MDPFIEDLDLKCAPWDLAEALGPSAGLAFLDRPRAYAGETDPSVLGFTPALWLEARGRRCAAWSADGFRVVHEGDPLEFLTAWVRRTGVDGPGGRGWIGFLGYGLGAATEGLRSRHPNALGMPDMHWVLHDPLLLHDPGSGTWTFVAHGFDPRTGRTSRDLARRRIEAARARLRAALTRPAPAEPVDAQDLRSNLDWPGYRERIERLRAYLEAGDLYQANLARRFTFATEASGLALHGRLRARTPMPFGAYLHGGDWELTVHTPERFLRRRGARIDTDPIKGTRPRGKDAAEDEALRADLLADPKEAAEHLMIVDLERNDLGRICRYGSVRVSAYREVHTLPTLHHLVSRVEGVLRPGVELPEILRATFPGGSITG
ncbi:MAG: anthranilate synthase component I family protein, partial [Myxococcales bacterium]|nr:anthranilate synthase component I family protein [Myxococcales bacterium]